MEAPGPQYWQTWLLTRCCHFLPVPGSTSPPQAGLYFLTARNSSCEEKYPLVLTVTTSPALDAVTDCALEDGSGPPLLADVGAIFARDGDDLILKTNLRGGAAPFQLSWSHNDRAVAWSARVAPYNREGCVGLRILAAGPQDEGSYRCTVANREGRASFTATLLVDCKYPSPHISNLPFFASDAEQKESELLVELCNCPMLDCITPLMSWTNTPIGTPRRTPLPTPHSTPLVTPRATPRATPRGTPRATPSPLPRLGGYNPGEYRSPSRTSLLEDQPPPRRRFVQPPEIFSSFSSKQANSHTKNILWTH